MMAFLIDFLPSFLQAEGTLNVWGEFCFGVLLFIGFIILGTFVGLFVYRRFRFAVSSLEKDNAKNAERLRVYEGAVDKQFRIHDYSG